MKSFNRVVIDPEALVHNYRYLKSRVAPGVRFMAMVKSDAYGHSMTRVAQLLEGSGCSVFGVAEVAEGVDLRDSGCRGDIFIFLGFDPPDVDYFFSHNLTPVVFTFEDLVRFSEAQNERGRKLPVFLKFDCGMSRLGFSPNEAVEVFSRCRKLSIEPVGIMSHFPCSDNRHSKNSQHVADLFYRIDCQNGEKLPLVRSICNSGGLLYQPYSHGDMVRIGISLYGYYPDGDKGREKKDEEGLRPAMSCVSRIIQVKTVAAGSGISYGHTYITDRETKIAVLPIGYSDGVLRTMSNRAEVLIRGQRVPIRGRICMNMCMADISSIENASVGDEVVILGSQGRETIDADQIGEWSGTISYEVLCALGNNNPREFLA
ncbi:MAG: alanine racemase [Desulfobulbaceae bacterium]|nr:MAG: alanine racemase [Desulfobulbaceae bacterium]